MTHTQFLPCSVQIDAVWEVLYRSALFLVKQLTKYSRRNEFTHSPEHPCVHGGDSTAEKDKAWYTLLLSGKGTNRLCAQLHAIIQWVYRLRFSFPDLLCVLV